MRQRKPPPGLVHHSDRGVQYACGDYGEVLQQHLMIPSMSRPANPYDDASCESFLKTLKREEIYANEYRDLEHLFANLEAFIEQYYNRCRLHSALGYRSPEEFEQDASTTVNSAGATMSFFRHTEIYQSDEKDFSSGERPHSRPPAHRPDESPAGYPSASCSPAEPISASPAERHPEGRRGSLERKNHGTASVLLADCLRRGVHPSSPQCPVALLWHSGSRALTPSSKLHQRSPAAFRSYSSSPSDRWTRLPEVPA